MVRTRFLTGLTYYVAKPLASYKTSDFLTIVLSICLVCLLAILGSRFDNPSFPAAVSRSDRKPTKIMIAASIRSGNFKRSGV